MGEIVFYDGNPIVRELMRRKFEKSGLQVAVVPTLEQSEDVLRKCRNPIIFIADLSRQPEFLPKLQAFVARYVNAPSRCVLTSTQPKKLAPYLRPRLEENFFSHVVERPFKSTDFLNFIGKIAQSCQKTMCFALDQHASCVNSSVEQIIGQKSDIAVDENLVSQVEEIYRSTTFQTDSVLGKLAGTPQKQPLRGVQSEARTDRSMAVARSRELSGRDINAPESRRTSALRARNIASGPDPVQNREAPQNRNMSLPSREKPSPVRTMGRENAVGRVLPKLRNAKNDKGVPKFQDMAPAILSMSEYEVPANEGVVANKSSVSSGKSPIDAAGISAMRGLKCARKEPPAPKMMTVASTFEAPMIEAENAFSTDFMEADEPFDDKSTMCFSSPSEMFPEQEFESCNSTNQEIAAAIVPDEAEVHYGFDIPWLVSVLRMSLVRQKRFTLVCSKNAQDQIVFLIASGRVEWVERVRANSIPDVRAFLEMFPPELMPGHDMSSILNASMRDIFEKPELTPLATAVSQMVIRQMPDILRYFDGCPADIFAGIPAKWATLALSRPRLAFEFSPVLFDFLRSDAESVLTPECFAQSKFGARPFRTPLNAAISLQSEENDILKSLQTPQTIAELKAAGKKHVTDILYRLVGFEFADIVCES